MSEAPLDVSAIRSSYGLDRRELADALSCPVLTVDRWERGDNSPTGIYRAVLQAMDAAAELIPEERARAHGKILKVAGVSGLLKEGLDAILTKETWNADIVDALRLAEHEVERLKTQLATESGKLRDLRSRVAAMT